MDSSKELKKWWLSIDGALDATEQKQFEEDLKIDAQLAETYLQAQKMDEELQKIEVEEPSMRFSKNVLEQLPKLYKKINIEPLFSKKSLIIGALVVLLFILLSLLLAFTGDSGSQSGTPDFWLTYVEGLTSIPSHWLLTVGFIGFCLAAIIGMDQFLKKQFFQKKRRLTP